MGNVENKISTRKHRWNEFLKLDGHQSFIHLIYITDQEMPVPLPNPENKQARIEYAWAMYLRRLEQIQWLEDDAIPFINPYTGTELFAEAFGCQVHRPTDNNPFAKPLISSPGEVEKIKVPSVNCPPLTLVFEIADELRRRAGPEAVMRMVDIQSPMDIAALIWDKNTFYTALIETPEAVLELAAKVKLLLVSFLDEWFNHYGCEFIAHFPEYYFSQGITLSEDEIGAVNPRMFEKYYLPELVELSEHFGGMGMHCCANAHHQWASIKKIPGLKMLNLVQPKEILDEAHAYFADYCAQMQGWQMEWELSRGPEQFPERAHLVLTSTVTTHEEALKKAEIFHHCFS